jgi:hypothetical protein
VTNPVRLTLCFSLSLCSNRAIRVLEKLANTERHLDISKNHSLRAEDNTDELKKLNRSIFRPAITFNKDGKRAAKEAKIQARYDDDREERERTLMDVRDSQNTLGKATTYGRDDNGRGQLTGAQQAIRKEQRSRYQFESTNSDDEMEDEMDDNLNEIGDAAKRLKALGLAMGGELDTQNTRIDRISEKATSLDNRMFRNTEKVKFLSLPHLLVYLCSFPLAAQAHQVIRLFGRAFHCRGQLIVDSNTYSLFFSVQFTRGEFQHLAVKYSGTLTRFLLTNESRP